MGRNTNREDTACAVLGPEQTLGVIGVGVMGRALVRGVLRSSLLRADQLWGATRRTDTNKSLATELGIPVVTDCTEKMANAGTVLLCVKPTQVGAVIARLRQSGLRPDTLLISIAAGVTTSALEELSATPNPWVRAMPNTPSVVGESMTVICGGRAATGEHLARAQKLFEAVGLCRVVDEHHFNAITALSGSGPAYIYLIIEALADAGVRVGLPRTLATELVAQTVVGAAKMVQTTGRHPAALRDDVTTPAGCTIGGLLMLEDGKIRSVLARAVEEATRIAQNLGRAHKAE